MGVAFVSRVAKNFQDYCVNVITQQVGARLYADGIRHSLELPYTLFEDQRSGETLGKLQKVRTDVEKLITMAVNLVFTTLIGLVFVMVYAARVHWSVVPAYLLTVPLLGGLSSVLSRKIKEVQKHIVRETTALAGATTESLRNIELVKSLGLAQQEIARLNATTAKILKLELKKVRYLRSLSFIQGTCVNLLRTSILFLMLYLIFTQRITVGQFFSLFIYSFFIFGPLQELGNVINVYRETEVSLQNFETILNLPPEPRPLHPVTVDFLDQLRFDDVSFQHQSASAPALREISFEVDRGETIAFVGPSGAGKTTLVKLLVGLYRPKAGHIYYNGVPEDEIAIDRLRERIGFVTQDAQLFSGSIRENLRFVRPDATRRGVPGGAGAGVRARPAGARRPRAGHGDRRGRRQGVGRREAAPVDCPRAAAPAAAAGVRRGDVVARFAHRRGDQPDDPRRGRQPRCDHVPDRAPAFDGAARGSHLRAGARPHRGVRPPQRAAGEQGTVLCDVAPAGGRGQWDFADAVGAGSRVCEHRRARLPSRWNLPLSGCVAMMAVMRLLIAVFVCVAAVAQPKTGEWQSMFDGKTLQGWRETAFTGHGKSRVENGTIVLAAGAPMTGVTFTGALPEDELRSPLRSARESTATISLPA